MVFPSDHPVDWKSNSWSNTPKHLLVHTNTYQYIPNTYSNTFHNIGIQVQISTYCVLIHVNTYPIHANTNIHGGWKPVSWTKIWYMQLHTKYMLIHTNTYHNTHQHTYKYKIGSAQGFLPCMKLLACIDSTMCCMYLYILTSIGMYRKNSVYILYLVVCIDIFSSIDWYILV